MRTLRERRSDKHRGFMYRFWFCDEVHNGYRYMSRAQMWCNIGRWFLGYGLVILSAIGLSLAGLIGLAILIINAS